MTNAFFALHHGLPRQSAGSDATTRLLLRLAGDLPAEPRAIDLGCGPGRSALVLAREADARVTALDTHEPFLDELRAAAEAAGVADRIVPVAASMADPPYPDASFDLVWSEGAAYVIGFETALRTWKRLLAPGGTLVVTEVGWTAPSPSAQARAFWDPAYPLRSTAENVATAVAAGYDVLATYLQPDRDWFDEYYDPLAVHVAAADRSDPDMAAAADAAQAEIDLRRVHGGDYGYTGYVLRARTGGAPG